MHEIYVYDPTATDSLSKVRGVGRYIQILQENLGDNLKFTSDINSIPQDSTFINPFFNILQPPIITRKIARRQIAVIHDLIPLKYPAHFPIGLRGKINIFRNKQALKNYDCIITDSEASKKDIISIVPIKEKTIKVIYPVVAKAFHTITPVADQSKNSYFLYVGDATWNKNLTTLAKAIQIANVTCYFVGKIFSQTENITHPWQKQLHDFLEIAKADPRFHFPGFVSDEILISLYKNAVANILVSTDEGFGFSYVEAATLGVPSILSDISVLHETAGDSALFADAQNPQSIADGISKMVTDKPFRDELAENAKKRSQFFDPDGFKNNLLSICS